MGYQDAHLEIWKVSIRVAKESIQPLMNTILLPFETITGSIRMVIPGMMVSWLVAPADPMVHAVPDFTVLFLNQRIKPAASTTTITFQKHYRSPIRPS